MDKVWCVLNKDGYAPKYLHTSEQSAKDEAKRLAKRNPDHEFFVMESVGMAIKREVFYYAHEKQSNDFNDDDIPF